MKPPAEHPEPSDARMRRAAQPVIAYPPDQIPPYDSNRLNQARATLSRTDRVTVNPRDAATFQVPAGHFFRIISTEGAQVGDLNLWNQHTLAERFYSGKTRALHGKTRVSF